MSTPFKPAFGNLGESEYSAKINTPARSREYFDRFHRPLIDNARRDTGQRLVTLIDVACGYGHELDFVAEDPDVNIVALDLSGEMLEKVRERMGTAMLVMADVECPPMQPEIADVGIAVNSMIYKPDKMLACLRLALKPSAACAVNFRAYDNPHNTHFFTHCIEQSCTVADRTVTLFGEEFEMKEIDYTRSTDPSYPHLGRQVFFRTEAEIRHFIALSGMHVDSHDTFNFASPANPDNQHDVFTLRKERGKWCTQA